MMGFKKGQNILMEENRFSKFILLIDSVSKGINKTKVDFVAKLGVKSVCMLWLYELSLHPKGLTASELADSRNIDRSLVSREITALKNDGYVKLASPCKKRGYNVPIVLTDKGREVAKMVEEQGMLVQNVVNNEISEEELKIFYSVLEKIDENFKAIRKNDR